MTTTSFSQICFHCSTSLQIYFLSLFNFSRAHQTQLVLTYTPVSGIVLWTMVDLPGASPSKKRVPFSLRSHQASIASQLRVWALEPLLRLSYVSEKHELICWSKRCPWFSLELLRMWCFTAQAGRTRLNMRCPSRQGITLRRCVKALSI